MELLDMLCLAILIVILISFYVVEKKSKKRLWQVISSSQYGHLVLGIISIVVGVGGILHKRGVYYSVTGGSELKGNAAVIGGIVFIVIGFYFIFLCIKKLTQK